MAGRGKMTWEVGRGCGANWLVSSEKFGHRRTGRPLLDVRDSGGCGHRPRGTKDCWPQMGSCKRSPGANSPQSQSEVWGPPRVGVSPTASWPQTPFPPALLCSRLPLPQDALWLTPLSSSATSSRMLSRKPPDALLLPPPHLPSLCCPQDGPQPLQDHPLIP